MNESVPIENQGLLIVTKAIKHSMEYIDAHPGLIQEGSCLQGAVEALKFIVEEHPDTFEHICLLGSFNDQEGSFTEDTYTAHFRLLLKYREHGETTWISAASGNKDKETGAYDPISVKPVLEEVVNDIEEYDGSLWPGAEFIESELGGNSIPITINERGKPQSVPCILASVNEDGAAITSIELIDNPVEHFTVLQLSKLFSMMD